MLGSMSHAAMIVFCFRVIPVHYWLYIYEVRICWTLLFHGWQTPILNLYDIYSRPLPSDSPWEPAAETTPSDPCLLALTPWVVFLPTDGCWLMHLTDYYKNDRMWLLRVSHQSHCHLHLLLLDYSLWGQPDAMSWGYLRSPMEKSLWRQTESSCQKPRERDILGGGSPLPAKPSGD